MIIEQTSGQYPELGRYVGLGLLLGWSSTTTEGPGNDFSEEDRCKGWWRLESDLTDSKGNNDLTPSGDVAYDAADHKEGAFSLSDGYGSRADALLDAGFPLKDGDAVKTGTICAGIRPSNDATETVFVCKAEDDDPENGVLILKVYNGYVVAEWVGGTVGSKYYVSLWGTQLLVVNHWYHVAFRFDGVNLVANLRIYDATAETVTDDDLSGTLTGADELTVSATSFAIRAYADGTYEFDGKVDEVVIFDELLTDDEIDAVRSQTFAEYDPLAVNVTISGGVSVGGATGISTSISVPLETSGGVEVGGEDFEYEILGPEEYYFVTMAGGLVVEGAFEFDIPEATTYEHEVTGDVNVGGEFDYDFFDPSTLSPVEKTLSGGVAVGGSLTGTAEYVSAEDLIVELDLSGGVAVGELRLPLIETTAPADTEAEILTRTLRGGVLVGGALGFDQEEATVYEHVPRFGGVQVGGNCIFLTLVPPSFILELAGGLSLGGTLFPGEEYLVETWALNGFLLSPALYSGFPFNSYCQYRNQAYAAGEDGIYLLEGEDDDGAPIYSGLRIGPTNFGVDNIKRLRAVYPGVAGAPELRVEGERYQQEGFYPLSRRDRFDVGREVQDRVMVLEVHDFDELSHVEFAVMPLMRR